MSEHSKIRFTEWWRTAGGCPRSRIGRQVTLLVVLGLMIPFGALMSSAPTASASGAAHVWYVAPNGSNARGGTAGHPFRTLQHAVNKASAGDTIMMAPGSYHQAATVSTANLTIRSTRGTAWLDGSQVVSGFVRSGSVWVRSGWNHKFNRNPTFIRGADDGTGAWRFVNPNYPTAAWPDQVWIDGVRLTQVRSQSAVGPRSFYVDYHSNKLIIGRNPAGHTVRASTLNVGLRIRAAGVHVTGLGVRRYADSVPDLGALIVERPRVQLRNVRVFQNATTGLLVVADHVTVAKSRFADNGLAGVRGSEAYYLDFTDNVVRHNNTEHFNYAPSAAGLKFTRSRHVRIERNSFVDNLATGVWMDESTYDVDVVGNRVIGNRNHGISFELSENVNVSNNVVAGNAGKGIQINNTGTVQIRHNEIVANDRAVSIVQDARTATDTWRPGHDRRRPNPDPTVPWQVRNVTVRNNVLATPTSGNCLLCVEDATHTRTAAQMDVHSNADLFARQSAARPAWLVVWSSGRGNPRTFKTFGEYRSHGQESLGIFSTKKVLTSSGTRTAAFRAVLGKNTTERSVVSARRGHIGAYLLRVGPR